MNVIFWSIALILLVIAATMLAAFLMCAHLICNICICKSYEKEAENGPYVHYARIAFVIASALNDSDKVRASRRILSHSKKVARQQVLASTTSQGEQLLFTTSSH